MEGQSKTCHLLVDEHGLRTFGEGGLDLLGRSAGFNAIAWKLDGSAGLERDLGIDYSGNPVSRSLLEAKLGARTAAAVEISWPPEEPKEVWDGRRCELIRYIGPSGDPEMQALEAMFRNPKQSYDLSLGTFVRDDQLGWIEGKVDWLGKQTKAVIEAQLEIDVPAQEGLLVALLADQAGWDHKARLAIVEGLYELWRDNWRVDDPMLNAAEFAARMPIESIGTQRGGGFDIWFGDADLFWGHGVLVRGTLDGGFEPGEMHG